MDIVAVNTQNNDNVVNRGIEVSKSADGTYNMAYSGTIKIMSLDEYSKMCRSYAAMKEEAKKTKEALRQETQNNVELKKKNQQYAAEIRKQMAANENLGKLIAKLEMDLNKFRNNQSGRARKLTPQIQKYIAMRVGQGVQISEIYREMIERNVNISYETVRRCVAGIKSGRI